VLLILDPAPATQPELQRSVDVIAHEIAHMWFGDLVTMKWWEGLWLKEAFATFMEMKATDAYKPQWQRWVDFGLSKTAAYDTDALASTRPIEFEVISPADAEGMYDILTYEKGAAVVRMLEQYLGDDQFQAGVRLYLERHSYGNTETTDLWDALEEATGQPVRALADTWIFQGGFPLVTASLAEGGRSLRLQQEHFRYTPGGTGSWHVPVLCDVVRGATRTPVRVLLDGPETIVDLGEPADAVVVNAGGHGFYRVRYAGDSRSALTARAQDLLTPIERYNLVDDAYAALLAGQATAADVLQLCRELADDDDLSVWQRIAGALGGLSRLLDGDDLGRFEAAVRNLAGPALDVAGWEVAEGESDRQRELRAALFTLLGTVGNDAKVVDRAAQLLDAGPGVDPALAAAAVTISAAHGDAARFEQYVERSETAPTPGEARRYIYALADFRDDALLDAALERARTGAIKTQDGPFVVARAIANRRQAARAWGYLAQHWDELCAKFPTNTISRMLSTIATVNDPALAASIEGFLVEHPVPQGAKTVEQYREKLRVNVALAERERAELARAVG